MTSGRSTMYQTGVVLLLVLALGGCGSDAPSPSAPAGIRKYNWGAMEQKLRNLRTVNSKSIENPRLNNASKFPVKVSPAYFPVSMVGSNIS